MSHMEPLLIFLKAMAVSVVVTFHPSITLACLNHLSDWVNVIWLPSDPDSPNLENSFLRSFAVTPCGRFRKPKCPESSVEPST